MSKKIEISKEDIEQAIHKYPTIKELAAYFKVGLSTIKRRLKEFNLSTFKRVFDEKKFEKFYYDGLTDADIAKKLNVSHGTISNYRNKLNLKSNFSYNRDLLKAKILESNLSDLELSNKLDVDVRVVKFFRNELIIDLTTYSFSDSEYQVIIGSLLGDGNISLNRSKNLGKFIFAHSEKQKEYAIWKTDILKNIMYYERVFNKVEHFDERTNKIYTSYFSYSKELTIFKNLYYDWYCPKKIVPINHIMNLDNLGLAIWYMDDGYKEDSGYCISTNCFSEKDLLIIQQYFIYKWNIYINIRKNNIVYIPSKYRDKFTLIIKPFIHSDCLYKLHNLKTESL